MKVGFIGTGNMGSLLIDAFIAAGALEPHQITASNRTRTKTEQLSERYPGLKSAANNRETAACSHILFLCVKPLEFHHVLQEIQDVTTPDQIAVSITSPVQLRHLESRLPCKISKIIPSITHLAGSGASLCIHGDRMQMEDRSLLEELFASISRPLQVSENFTRITSDFSSCGPAFLAFFLDQWIAAAVKLTGMEQQDLIRLSGEMLLGTGKLLTESGLTPGELQARVSVRGGITAEALAVLDAHLNNAFEQLIMTTQAKYDEDVHKLDRQFDISEVNRQQY
ncbi:late competence protein ComER [Paenibacillus sp. JX-17]|uniref:Pyrroline-5-carboxylate reductase n=1 Tax=Paenibacillus lacisoli TaxID=3064525 RepID=A0ABT9CA24_9BACL|nr:late competence protein ComER [Paenibacillus sp. JX-17]MDO7905499.1 late competence protein ComER [Paenibacillus sp. JX-17]